jgi:hypothetical protein
MSASVRALADAIDAAFEHEWSVAKPATPLPAAGAEDRRLLFRAIARGVLRFLQDYDDELIDTIRFEDRSDNSFRYKVREIEFDFSFAD